ncbi:hypothetical protein FNV68_41775 [Streptomyces sp. S1D4-23]|nr:hypothetical protein FNV61_40705 [Streptomyces sp. RLB3-6]QDO11873.1 hypothetical protein FNV68_41775 [Streptomyces sp. S1D4-23]
MKPSNSTPLNSGQSAPSTKAGDVGRERVGFVPYSPLGRGFLTDVMKPAAEYPADPMPRWPLRRRARRPTQRGLPAGRPNRAGRTLWRRGL